MEKKVRVRFAPSPTGGLHLGGVRTALYNYLFAKQHQGISFCVLKIQTKAVLLPGQKNIFMKPLNGVDWNLMKVLYMADPLGHIARAKEKKFTGNMQKDWFMPDWLIYAFDTPEELEAMRSTHRTSANPSPQYDHQTRMHMRNSFTLAPEETKKLLEAGTPHVIRIRMPDNETLQLNDMIRGQVEFNTSLVDDKVLLKADDMPTYHLAVVVDDFLMQITHAFRGEEWLPSAPVHLLLWRYLFGEEKMPAWAHFPLILKPDGNGKLSKRDSDRLGIPIFAMDWKDPASGEIISGFREKGFLPEAFVNMLAVLGWNDGTEQELYSIEELIEKFSIERVHKAGAKFNYEKAKWFNQEWIRKIPVEELSLAVRKIYDQQGLQIPDEVYLRSMILLIRERCHLLPEFYTQGRFFFEAPQEWDIEAIKTKWNAAKAGFFTSYIEKFQDMSEWNAYNLETVFKELAASQQIKAGELQLPFRIMLVGEKSGPPVFDIAGLLGKNETSKRINNLLAQTGNW